ncbi:MAG: hypothetical protein IJG53_09150 [Eggerthellaceae bacterium]|nr:hypothetical protein [Eggerthellaceae bacterium]
MVRAKEHGTRSMYNSGCRCGACRKANSEYEKARARRNARIAMGAEPARRVEVGEAEWRVRRLLRMGWTRHELERLTGLKRITLAAILGERSNSRGGELGYVTRPTIDVLDALLASRERDIADGVLVDAGPTKAIVRLLIGSLGRHGAAAALGWDIKRLDNLNYHDLPRVKLGTAREVEAAARRIRGVLAPAKQPAKVKTWEDRMAERRAAGYVVNPYTD